MSTIVRTSSAARSNRPSHHWLALSRARGGGLTRSAKSSRTSATSCSSFDDALPSEAALAFSITSRTLAYRVFYAVLGPIFPLLRALFPRQITTTERIGQAMLEVARHGANERILENVEINALAERAGPSLRENVPGAGRP